MGPDARRVVERLHLAPHPEGGWYRETIRTPRCTSILFLLPAGSYSAWHRVRGADEIWLHHGGDPLVLHLLGPGGLERRVVGPEAPQLLVPADVWQTAAPAPEEGPHGYGLVGCTVAPPFTFEGFELADRSALAAAHPEHAEIVARWCR